jgi:hypothetical protein
MSVEELERGYYWTIQNVYSYKNIWKRLTGLWDLWDKYAKRPEHVLLKEKIDVILLNENFRACAYSYTLQYKVNTIEEKHYQKELNKLLKKFLNQRTEILTQAS